MRWWAIGLISLAGAWLLAIAGLAIAGRRTAARELATMLPNMIMLLRGLRADPQVPRRSKWLLLVALVWIASPIDLVPEFIPVLGPLDDVIVAALVLRHVVRAAGPEVIRRHWRGGERSVELLLRAAGTGPLKGS